MPGIYTRYNVITKTIRRGSTKEKWFKLSRDKNVTEGTNRSGEGGEEKKDCLLACCVTDPGPEIINVRK